MMDKTTTPELMLKRLIRVAELLATAQTVGREVKSVPPTPQEHKTQNAEKTVS